MIFVTKFRANDLNPSKGKQIEFNKGVIDTFFTFKNPHEDAVFECSSLASPSVKKTIKVHFSLSPSRGDYKIYQNADGSPDLKDFFLDTLGLTSANLSDYYAIKKLSQTKYALFYIPNQFNAVNFFQQLTSDQLIVMPEKSDEEDVTHETELGLPAQTIYYGCPGTGKSHEVKKIAEGEKCEKVIWYKKEANAEGIYERVENPSDEEKKNLTNNVFRTTFHPDYDYATFVGCYKPVKDDDNKLDYRFIPQVFTNAYITALRHPQDPIYLIIEEINRGNCAQIFGDLFQLLDRRNGVSEYSIRPDTELSKYLASQNVPSEQLSLPANLNIYATMNTSDQSLFPMDSAFKRRWAMEYMPIKYDSDKASKFTIAIGDETYPWTGFLRMVNERILDATDSEDKQMGEYFIKDSVNEKEFINKVMFYIWNDVCKDHYTARRPTAKFFMRLQNHIEGEKEYFTFADLFDKEKNKDSHLLKEFIAYLEAKFIEEHKNATLDPATNHIDWAKYMAPAATEAETE